MAKSRYAPYSLYYNEGEECYCKFCNARIELHKQKDGILLRIPCNCEGAEKARKHNSEVDILMKRCYGIF